MRETEREQLFDIIEEALAEHGFRVLDGDDEYVYIRSDETDLDYYIKVGDCE